MRVIMRRGDADAVELPYPDLDFGYGEAVAEFCILPVLCGCCLLHRPSGKGRSSGESVRGGNDHQRGAQTAALAVGLTIGAAIDATLFDALHKGLLRNTLEWVAIGLPLVVVLDRPTMSLAGWIRPSIKVKRKPRNSIVLWLVLAIILPWILAWLVADAAGNWFVGLRRLSGSAVGPSGFEWLFWLLAGIATYSGASACGAILTFVVDEYLVSRSEGQAGDQSGV